MEAFDHMLEAWISVLSDSQVFPKDFCKQSSMQIFNTYLKCHLSPPDGSRGQVVIMICTLFFDICGVSVNAKWGRSSNIWAFATIEEVLPKQNSQSASDSRNSTTEGHIISSSLTSNRQVGKHIPAKWKSLLAEKDDIILPLHVN